MPTKAQLPDGPRRKFVEELFVHFREADRPTLRVIAKWIKDHKDTQNLRGTASTETIRRIMTGAVVPRAWGTVETLLQALCGLAGRGVDEDRWPDEDRGNWDPPSLTFKEELKQRWNAALDDYVAEVPQLPARRPAPVAVPAAPTPSTATLDDDPWATGPASPAGGFGGDQEEPPF